MNSGELLHALEPFAIEAAAEGGELEDAVAREREEGDDAEQDLGEFLHRLSVAPSEPLQSGHRTTRGEQHQSHQNSQCDRGCSGKARRVRPAACRERRYFGFHSASESKSHSVTVRVPDIGSTYVLLPRIA